jgi:hypothetical protein
MEKLTDLIPDATDETAQELCNGKGDDDDE